MSKKKEGLFAKFKKLFSKKHSKAGGYFHTNDYNAITFSEKLLRDVTKWKFIAVALVLLIGVITYSKQNNAGGYKNFIAVLEIEGVIETDSYRTEVLNKLAENKNLKGVFLKINSPGGTITGSEILYKEIKRLRAIVPVYSLIYDLGASGAYMAAIGSSQIFSHESSIVGSIGVLMQSLEVEDLANKIGARMQTYRSSQYKAQPDPFKKPNLDVKEYMHATIEANHRFFSQLVASERKISQEKLPSIANGKIFMGMEALELQLIDGISEENAVKKALEEKIGKKYDFVEISLKEEKKEGIISQIISDIFKNNQDSIYGAKVMAVMKM